MLSPRLIPVLLIHNNGLVKTVRFKDPKYVGDPLNAVKIFNEKEADELVVLDIDASVASREPDYRMIENLAAECRMPLCYGGGIKTEEQAIKILGLGVEKVALSSVVFDNKDIIKNLSEKVGRQSVVVVLDVKKRLLSHKYDCFIRNGSVNTKICPVEFSKVLEGLGAGEIFINSIDSDGMMKGYDLSLARSITTSVSIPVTICGGAGSIEDVRRLVLQENIIGAAAGSMFVFKGKYRAVLINYPRNNEKRAIFS